MIAVASRTWLLKGWLFVPSLSENDERVAVLFKPSNCIANCRLRQAGNFASKLVFDQVAWTTYSRKASIQERPVNPLCQPLYLCCCQICWVKVGLPAIYFGRVYDLQQHAGSMLRCIESQNGALLVTEGNCAASPHLLPPEASLQLAAVAWGDLEGHPRTELFIIVIKQVGLFKRRFAPDLTHRGKILAFRNSDNSVQATGRISTCLISFSTCNQHNANHQCRQVRFPALRSRALRAVCR